MHDRNLAVAVRATRRGLHRCRAFQAFSCVFRRLTLPACLDSAVNASLTLDVLRCYISERSDQGWEDRNRRV